MPKSSTAAVIITGKTAGKTRFVTEREVAMYNTLLFKKANRYILLDPDDDILSVVVETCL